MSILESVSHRSETEDSRDDPRPVVSYRVTRAFSDEELKLIRIALTNYGLDLRAAAGREPENYAELHRKAGLAEDAIPAFLPRPGDS